MMDMLQHIGMLALLLLGLSCATVQDRPHGDYAGYFDQLLRIEESTSRENFSESVRLYAELFRGYDPIFARDAYNACQLAAMTRSDNFDAFFLQCAASGVPMNMLLGNAHIVARYVADSLRLHALFVQGENRYLGRIDTSLRREFTDRYNLEQQNKGNDRYRAICTDNFNRIVELARKNRFPGEALIGPDDNLGNSHVLATLLHYPYSYTALESTLWNAVQEGNAQPMMVLYLYGFNQTRTSILYDKNASPDTTRYNVCYNFAFGKRSADLVEVNRQRRLRRVFSTEVEQRLESVAAKYRLDYKLGY